MIHRRRSSPDVGFDPHFTISSVFVLIELLWSCCVRSFGGFITSGSRFLDVLEQLLLIHSPLVDSILLLALSGPWNVVCSVINIEVSFAWR